MDLKLKKKMIFSILTINFLRNEKFDALKWLCLLSLIGFIYCFVFDLGYFTLFLDTESNSSQSNSFLNIIIENLSDNGFVLTNIYPLN